MDKAKAMTDTAAPSFDLAAVLGGHHTATTSFAWYLDPTRAFPGAVVVREPLHSEG